MAPIIFPTRLASTRNGHGVLVDKPTNTID
jgi:hypothetical protein